MLPAQTPTTQPRNRLCARCSGIPANLFWNLMRESGQADKRGGATPADMGVTAGYELFPGPNAYDKLGDSASTGCSLCKLFWDTMETPDGPAEPRYPDLLQPPHSSIRLENFHGWPKLSLYDVSLRLEIAVDVLGDDLAEATYRRGPPRPDPIGENADDPATFQLARAWISECFQHHHQCRSARQSKLPTRLLDVQTQSPDSVRLCLTSDFDAGEDIKYVTYSHCWGTGKHPEPLKTVRANLRGHEQQIPHSRLPRSFQDAVRVTRELGVRYLWIDSLCIVQDSPDELQAECARMDEVYSNSWCTIAASDASSSHDGFLHRRSHRRVDLSFQGAASSPQMRVTLTTPLETSWTEGLEGPLQTRGWVFQERQLSPRVLHYTRKGIMWECRTCIASESHRSMRGKEEYDKLYENEGYETSRLLDGSSALLLNSGRDPAQRGRTWRRIAHEYSARQISHLGDKLPALSGLAAVWKKGAPDDGYLAGIWESDLGRELAWFPIWDVEKHFPSLPASSTGWPPPSPYKGIPSWSWAAFHGEVEFHGDDWFDDPGKLGTLRVVRSSVQPAEKNPFGRVSGGTVVLSHRSLEVVVSETNFAGHMDEDLSSMKLYGFGFPQSFVYFDYSPLSLDTVSLLLLQLGIGSAVDSEEGTVAVCGLALLPLPNPSNGSQMYSRVGMFEFGDQDLWGSISHRREVVIT